VEVQDHQSVFSINGLRLVIGKPDYPVGKHRLNFTWEPHRKHAFPELLDMLDQEFIHPETGLPCINPLNLIHFESMLTSFAYGKHTLSYGWERADGFVNDLLLKLKPHWGMDDFGRFYNYHATQLQNPQAPQDFWQLGIYEFAFNCLMGASDKWGNRTFRQDLVSLT